MGRWERQAAVGDVWETRCWTSGGEKAQGDLIPPMRCHIGRETFGMASRPVGANRS
jgi:hypothetical protein